MITFSTISNIFSDVIKDPTKDYGGTEDIEKLIFLNMRTNRTLWDLEDSARLSELGDTHVADAKRGIDKNNQIRNDLIREIDSTLSKQLHIVPGPREKFYSESPGMIIDRLAIIFIKHSIIQKLLSVIQEDELKVEYEAKEDIIEGQIESIGQFLDLYLKRLASGEIFFEIQQAVKIYNDARVKKYIKEISAL